MESIIVLIIIVVVFNLFNAILRALKGGQTGSSKSTESVVPSPVFQERPEEFKDFWSTITEEPPLQGEHVSQPVELKAADEAPEKLKRVPEIAKEKALRKDVPEKKPAEIEGNFLQQGLSEKKGLLAALIFHEILEPPVSLQRKR